MMKLKKTGTKSTNLRKLNFWKVQDFHPNLSWIKNFKKALYLRIKNGQQLAQKTNGCKSDLKIKKSKILK